MVSVIVKKNGIEYDYGYSRLLHNGIQWKYTVVFGTSIMDPLSDDVKNYIYKQTLLLI